VVLSLTFAGLLFACGGAQHNSYRVATSKQESCCRSLADGAAEATCLQEIPHVDASDRGAETAQVNRETFACVENNFVCDPASGRATQASAQAQLDCITELESGAQ
jgi:hypothetical protein